MLTANVGPLIHTETFTRVMFIASLRMRSQTTFIAVSAAVIKSDAMRSFQMKTESSHQLSAFCYKRDKWPTSVRTCLDYSTHVKLKQERSSLFQCSLSCCMRHSVHAMFLTWPLSAH
jgi:hypothetical protein